MTRRRSDVEALTTTISELHRLHLDLPPGYEELRRTISTAKSEARRQLGVLLADLHLEAP